MSNPSTLIVELSEKINALVQKQAIFQSEVAELRKQLELIQHNQFAEKEIDIPAEVISEIDTKFKPTEIPNNIVEIFESYEQKKQLNVLKPHTESAIAPKKKLDVEKFIGENLINKIGIAITIIGVAIGVNYSIEHDLISPLFRIILGYLVGAGLLGFGYKLKLKYVGFSAVLLSGAIAIFYFISFAAFNFYHLISQQVAFSMMLLFTVYAVYTSIQYNIEIVAHIGLVGAYAVPFLLGDKSGSVFILLLYTTIINIGILIIAFKKYWKNLNYSSFIVSWLIFVSWQFGNYNSQSEFGIACIFVVIFFLLFYVMVISYKLLRNEKFAIADIGLLLANSFIFYKLAYSLLDGQVAYKPLLGLFTVMNAFIHLYVSRLIIKQKDADKNIYYLFVGLFLTFITIAIPVQLKGSWITIFWICESAILLWIGRTKKVDFYEKMSYPILIISFLSLLSRWNMGYNSYFFPEIPNPVTPIFNVYFLTSLLYIIVIGLMTYVQQKNKKETDSLEEFISYVLPVLLLITIYFSVSLEISRYWNQLQFQAEAGKKILSKEYGEIVTRNEFVLFKGIWQSIYAMFYLFILSFVNMKKIKNYYLAWINMAFDVWVLFLFITAVCYHINELQDTNLHPSESLSFHQSGLSVFIRYLSYGSCAFLLFSIRQYITEKFIYPTPIKLKVVFDIIVHVSLIIMASYQLVHIFFLYTDDPSFGKYCLSVMWGIYALVLIILGISKDQKHLRIMAIVLFSFALLKLFFYDTEQLGTIGKTIVFVTLGVLLLIVSFLYNKYKNSMTETKDAK